MEIKDLKEMLITNYLDEQGVKPVRRRGHHLYYQRFWVTGADGVNLAVDTKLNLWRDLTDGKGGSIIDLVMLDRRLSFHDACNYLASIANPSLTTKKDISEFATIEPVVKDSKMEVRQVREIQLTPVIDYIQKRGISLSWAKRYCKEVFYNFVGSTKHNFFALGFPNDNGSYVIRNGKVKITVGHQDISTIWVDRESQAWMVVEGFMDFLSYLEFWGIPKVNVIVLNSTSNLKKALKRLENCKVVYSLLDADKAGTQALETLVATFGDRVVNKNYIFEGYKDLNEKLMKERGLV